MRILDRYILKGFIAPFLLFLATSVFLYWIIDLFGHLDEILKAKIPLANLINYYLSLTPLIFVQTTPIAVLLATIFLLGILNRHNEITALKAAGLSTIKILRPILFISLLLSMMVFIVNDAVIPKVGAGNGGIENGSRITKNNKIYLKDIKDIIFYGKGNRIIYSKSYDAKASLLKDIIVHKHDKKQNLIARVGAQEARWIDGEWIGREVTLFRLDNSGQIIDEPQYFESARLAIEERPSEILKRRNQIEFMSYRSLKGYIDSFAGTSSQIMNKLLVELHYKLSFPFISFIIVLVGSSVALKNRRGGMWVGVGMSLGIAFGFYGVLSLSLALGRAGMIPPIAAAWSSNIIFLSLGITLLQRNK